MHSSFQIIQRYLSLLAVTITAIGFSPLSAQPFPDPGIPDTVRIGCPINGSDMQLGDSVAIPVYIVSDTKVIAFVCGFTYNSDIVEITSFKANPSIFFGAMVSQFHPHPETNSCLVGGFTLNSQMNVMLPGTSLIGHLNMKLLQSTTGTTIRMDSTFVPPAGPWVLAVDTADGNASFDIRPQYSHCGQCDIGINTVCDNPTPSCGDTDASKQIDVSDAVCLINYIFASGPAPQDDANGDVDCSNQTDITDAVYLINYIFAGGDPPCAACP